MKMAASTTLSSSSSWLRRTSSTDRCGRRTLSVRFRPMVCVRSHLHINDMTREEVQNAYYKHSGYDTILYDVIVAIAEKERRNHSKPQFHYSPPTDCRKNDGGVAITATNDYDDDDVSALICCRGIDTIDDLRAKLLRRRRSIDAVLNVQSEFVHQQVAKVLDALNVVTNEYNSKEDDEEGFGLCIDTDLATAAALLPKAISKAYQEAGAAQCRSIAYFIGLQDERNVKGTSAYR